MMDVKLLEGQSQISALFGIHLMDIIEDHPELKVITADMSYIANLELFKAMHNEQFINVGISEQNMIGVAAGLTSEGYKCVCLAQACFISMRCFEQVRQFMSYMGIPIILVGLSAGFGLQFMGNTHYAIEDMALMRSIPGITIFSPADALETVKAFDAALALDGPCYIRLTGSDRQLVYKEDYKYNLTKANLLKEGKDVVLLSTGSMVASSLAVASELEEILHVNVGCVDLHCISPFDNGLLISLKEAKLIVTIEEHAVNGGLGSVVCEFAGEQTGFPPILKIGINGYSVVGDYQYLLEQHQLTIPQMVKRIEEKYNSIV